MSSIGCRESDVEYRMSSIRCRVSSIGCRVSIIGCRISNVEYQVKSKIESRESKKSAMLLTSLMSFFQKIVLQRQRLKRPNIFQKQALRGY